MGYLPAKAIRDCIEQLERANISVAEAVAGLRSRAPGMAGIEGNRWPILFNALNDHAEPILLCEWLEDLLASLRYRAWPEADLECFIHAVARVRQSAPWSTLAEAEERYQGALESEVSRARAELVALKHPHRGPAGAGDRDRLTARIEQLQRAQHNGRPAQSGDVLRGRYELEELIGRGGFSIVWLALDRETDDYVAVKILRGELRNDEYDRQRFFAGAATMQREAARNPGIVRVIEHRCHDGPYHFFVMEYIAGGTLEQLIAKNQASTRVDAESILLATCDIVARLHANGCLHLDIKPSNILLDDLMRPKLTDFEHVHRVQDVWATHQGRPHVSPHYSAPEIVAGSAAQCESDVFSLARVALSIQLGRSLDSSVETSDFLDEEPLSIALTTVLRRATLRAPNLRHSDAGMLRAALAEAFADPRDFDRWVEKVAIPEIIARRGVAAMRPIDDLLRSLRDVEQLRRLLVFLGYEPLFIGDDVPLSEAAFTIAEVVCGQGDALRFWHCLERHRGAPLAERTPRDANFPLSLSSRLKSLILGEVWLDSPELCRFLAMVALPGASVALLPQSSRVSPIDFVVSMLGALEREGALSRFASLLVTARPGLANRLLADQVSVLADDELRGSLWSVWRSIPAVDPGTYLRSRLPSHAHGFLAPLWSDARIRLVGAIQLYRHRLTNFAEVSLPLPDEAAPALSQLLAVMFDDAELRNLAAYLGDGVGNRLDVARASLGTLTASFVGALTQSMLLPVFALLLQRRPRWEAELLGTAEKFGLTREACRTAGPPKPTTKWCLGELLLTIVADGQVADGQVTIEDIGVVTGEIPGEMAAPRLRTHQAADWLFKRALVDPALIARLRALAPQHERAIAEFTADSALEAPFMGLCPVVRTPWF